MNSVIPRTATSSPRQPVRPFDQVSHEHIYKIRSRKLHALLSTAFLGTVQCSHYYAPSHRAEALSDDARLTSVCLSVAYIVNNSRTERHRKTIIGTQVAYVTRDSDTAFKVKRSRVNLQGHGNIVADSRTSLIFVNSLIFMAPTAIGSKARWAPQA